MTMLPKSPYQKKLKRHHNIVTVLPHSIQPQKNHNPLSDEF